MVHGGHIDVKNMVRMVGGGSWWLGVEFVIVMVVVTGHRQSQCGCRSCGCFGCGRSGGVHCCQCGGFGCHCCIGHVVVVVVAVAVVVIVVKAVMIVIVKVLVVSCQDHGGGGDSCHQWSLWK